MFSCINGHTMKWEATDINLQLSKRIAALFTKAGCDW